MTPPRAPEHRWPAFIAIALVIVADAALPSSFGIIPRIVVPCIAAGIAIALLVYNPRHFTRETRLSRAASIGLAILLAAVNQAEVVATVAALVSGSADSQTVLLQALRVWFTDVLVFGLLYWELDREGPVARRREERREGIADFRFPQEDVPATGDWQPAFFDYVYFSLSNMMAFSPTDAMPLRIRAKALMAVQAFTGFALLALVIARAVNILV